MDGHAPTAHRFWLQSVVVVAAVQSLSYMHMGGRDGLIFFEISFAEVRVSTEAYYRSIHGVLIALFRFIAFIEALIIIDIIWRGIRLRYNCYNEKEVIIVYEVKDKE